ncbi:unnamed protein product [Adineta ricciae]|uniref:ADP/ATP translocase n=1 Tax=Adineta ricciae TaxID=249248 RepID=A0A815QSV9_ADIRI|nr:unnamed protein product [Adineta ricciae]CAF1467906.1 unnamed protein product [Adineta ricciae]
MLMTSGLAVRYKGSIDCIVYDIRNESVTSSLLKGTGSNIVRGIEGTGVLVGLDKLVQFYTGTKVDTNTSGGR